LTVTAGCTAVEKLGGSLQSSLVQWLDPEPVDGPHKRAPSVHASGVGALTADVPN